MQIPSLSAHTSLSLTRPLSTRPDEVAASRNAATRAAGVDVRSVRDAAQSVARGFSPSAPASKTGDTPPASSPRRTSSPAATAHPQQRVYSSADKQAVLDAWGSRTGDRSFNVDLDLNADGRIDAADLARVLANYSEHGPPDAPSLDGIGHAWGRNAGEEGFSDVNDLNADGRIDAKDLSRFLASQAGEQGETDPRPADPEAAGQQRLEDLLSRYGARAGDEAFTSSLDFDGDGQIGPPDLASLLARWNDDES